MPESLPEEMLEHEVTKNVSGVQTKVTVKQLIAEAQKSGAGDQKLRQAHDLEAEMADQAAFHKDMKDGIANKDPAALRRGLQRLGMTPEEIAAAVPEPGQEGPTLLGQVDDLADDLTDDLPQKKPKARQRTRSPDSEVEPSLPPEAVEVLQAMAKEIQGLKATNAEMYQAFEGAKTRTQRSKYTGPIDNVLDNHPELGTMIGKLGPEAAQQFRDQAYRAVGRRTRDFPTFGARTIEAGLTDFHDYLKKIGAGTPKDDAPLEGLPITEDLRQVLGAGPSSGGTVGGLHQAGEESKPVSINDPDFTESFARRIMAKVAGRAGSKKT